MSSDPRSQYTTEPLYGPAGGPMSHSIPLQGPVSHPDGPRDYAFPPPHQLNQFPVHPSDPSSTLSNPSGTPVAANDRRSPKQEPYYPLNGTEMYNHNQELSSPPSPSQDTLSNQGGAGANHYPSSTGRRLPPIMQVEKQQVTTSATQLASASRRRNEAHFVCPVPGCGSTFTRRFNLRGRLYF
jgi:hypothetical protein